MNVYTSSLLGLYDSWCQEWDYYTESWPVDPLLLGSCMLLRSGKTKGESEMPPSELSKFMELWLEESRKRDEERQKEEVRREEERRRYEEEWRRKEEEWRRREEERARRSEEIMRTLTASLAEREPRRPRTEFGVDLLKLTKLTLSDDIEAFMTTFERSTEAHEIERVKWLVLLAPQLTGKAQQAYAALSSEDSKNFTKVKEAIFKRYDINEETYRQRFRSAKAKEGESPTEIVTHLTDMAAKWLKEHDTRAKVIDMIVICWEVSRRLPASQENSRG